ncbi:MAG: transcriptional repressor LexA [Acidimicrobiia bacterium]
MPAIKHRSGLTPRQKEVLEYIDENLRDKGYPPSVREIATALGLTSPATVHNHLNTLEDKGYIKRDPTKPRAMEVLYESSSGAVTERRPVKHIPLIGNVAAGTGVLAEENIEESYPLPQDFTGDGALFMLKVRGDSMIDAGIFDGDFVVVRQQKTANNGDIVVASINDDEATVKTFIQKGNQVILRPQNPTLTDIVQNANEVDIYGKVVTVLRRL